MPRSKLRPVKFKTCLNRREGVFPGLVGIARGHWKKARWWISEADEPGIEDVHVTRVGHKRLRALWRLIRPVVDIELCRRENRRLRDSALMLGPIRDADVGAGLLKKAVRKYGLGKGRGMKAVVSAMKGHITAHREDLDIERGKILNLACREMKLSVGVLAGQQPSCRGWSILKPGLARSYEKARDCYYSLDSIGDQTLANHEWRKRLKTLTYQVEIIVLAWPKGLGRFLKNLKRLSQLTGDYNDLMVLRRRATDMMCEREYEHLDWPVFLEWIDKRVEELHRKALLTASRTLELPTEKFINRLQKKWFVWRKR